MELWAKLGNTKGRRCAEAVAISYGAKSALRAAARERWEELMSGG